MATAAENEANVRAFFAGWGESFDALIEAFRKYVAEDCVLKQTRTPDLHGLAEILPFLEHVRASGLMETMKVDVLNIVATDDSVAAERIDIMYVADGTEVTRFPCASVMEMKAGKIAGWRDYFDSADMPTGGVEIVNQELSTV